jgi:methylmalonyl-CoA mutase N-terminal domain/subunit
MVYKFSKPDQRKIEKAIFKQEHDFDPVSKLGKPGEYPFTRGIHPTMYKTKIWTMRQYSGFGSAKETNQRFKYLLQQGQTGISVAFDLPTQMGYGPDNPMAKGEVAKAGVSINSIYDMRELFDEIPLDKISVSMTINATAPLILAMLISIAEENGIPQSKLSGTVQNDILKEYIARGCYIFPPGPSLKLAIDLIEYCVKFMPNWNFISISGYHIREAGSTASQEIGFTFANAICYIEEALKRGMDINAIGRRVSFFFNAYTTFFEEIAKFRAARRMWAKIMKERFGATDTRAMMLRFHTQTAGCTLTVQEPENNLVRVALQTMAAVLGGTQSLHTNAMDEALALPTEFSAKLALRTQQIVAYETDITNVVDPFGGSYYLENLTDKIEQEAWSYIKEVEKLGGAVKAVEKGYFQKEIEKSAILHQRRVESGERIIVGVNKFCDEKKVPETKIEYLKVDPKYEEELKQRAILLKYKRDRGAFENGIKQLKKAIEGGENLMPAFIVCVKNLLTLDEICSILKEYYSTHKNS